MKQATCYTGLVGMVMVLATAGCKMPTNAPATDAAGGLGLVAAAKAPAANNVFSGKAAITNTSSMDDADGMSHVRVRVSVDQGQKALPVPKFTLMNLGSVSNTWTTALVTLFSGTASTGYNASVHEKSIDRLSEFDGGTPDEAIVDFGPLRPATDYTARCFLQDTLTTVGVPQIAGSLEKTGVTLDAGPNTISFNISPNGSFLTQDLGSSANFNAVTGGNIVVGDTVNISTGLDASQSGVDHADIFLSGSCYSGGGPVKVGTVTSGSLNSFTWITTLNVGGGFQASSFSGGSGHATVSGTLTIKAYHADSSSSAIGQSTINLNVFGRPTNVTIDLT